MSIKNRIKKFIGRFLHVVLGSRNIILFRGQGDFDGNARALFNYMQKSDRKYKYVWYVRDKAWSNQHPDGCDIIVIGEKYTLKKAVYENCASYVFFDNECPVIDGCPYPEKSFYAKNIIYLSHGCPPIKNASKYIRREMQCVTQALITSENLRELMAKIRGMDADKLFVCGHPRNDVIFNAPVKYDQVLKEQYKKVVLWMPTFRKFKVYNQGDQQRMDSRTEYLYGLPLIHKETDLEEINRILQDYNMLLVIKPHPHAAREGIENLKLSNICVWTNEVLSQRGINLYSLFMDTDALVSDYSTVTFDFMMTDHPIGYVIDDMDEYKLGFAYDDVLDYMPGNKIRTKKDFYDFLEDVSENKDRFCQERRRVSQWANTYQDGKNCERIVQMFGL